MTLCHVQILRFRGEDDMGCLEQIDPSRYHGPTRCGYCFSRSWSGHASQQAASPHPLPVRRCSVARLRGKPACPGRPVAGRQCSFPPASPLPLAGLKAHGASWEAAISGPKYLLGTRARCSGRAENKHTRPALFTGEPLQFRGPAAAIGINTAGLDEMWMPLLGCWEASRYLCPPLPNPTHPT